jgi:hypothetical protein
MSDIEPRPFWVSWYTSKALGPFEWHGPWWITGQTCEEPPRSTVCAAVLAVDEEHAKEAIRLAYDKRQADLEWRFCNERERGWAPWKVNDPTHTSRFQPRPWMRWPYMTEERKVLEARA